MWRTPRVILAVGGSTALDAMKTEQEMWKLSLCGRVSSEKVQEEELQKVAFVTQVWKGTDNQKNLLWLHKKRWEPYLSITVIMYKA